MTDVQRQLIETLEGRNIAATWNDRFLNCTFTMTRVGGKRRTLRWGLSFDDSATLEGPKVCDRNTNKAYVESFARDTFFEAIRIGQGDDEAISYVNECRRAGVRDGATQEWIDSHDVMPIHDEDDD